MGVLSGPADSFRAGGRNDSRPNECDDGHHFVMQIVNMARGFYQLGCALYPITLVALAVAGPGKFPATLGALAALG